MSMTSDHRSVATFRDRLRAGAPLLGTFVKTPSVPIVEVLALSPIDVVCLDQEHAPFGPAELDACIAVARAQGLPTLVRIPGGSSTDIGRVLDLGATGVVVPHVDSVEDARRAASAARFAPEGTRGFAGSHRAAAYATRTITDNLSAAASTTVVVQIESPEAVEAAEAIAAVDGVDALFIGPVDLAVAMGARSPADDAVVAAMNHVMDAGRRAGTAVGAFASSPASMRSFRDRGATFLLAGSDQSAVMDGMRRLRDDFDGAGHDARE